MGPNRKPLTMRDCNNSNTSTCIPTNKSNHNSKNKEQTQTQTQKNLPGIWLGIDLGTTNTTAAFYSPNKHVSKLIRFTPSIAKESNVNNKYGKILPSALYYDQNGVLNSIGRGALQTAAGGLQLPKVQEPMKDDDGCKNENGNGNGSSSGDEAGDGAKAATGTGTLLTSVKRIWGMDTVQIKDEISNDESFLDSCPFQTTWVNDELRIVTSVNTNTSASASVSTPISTGVGVPQDSGEDPKRSSSSSIAPIEVAEILLRTIREEASAYFQRERRKNKHIPLGLERGQMNMNKNMNVTDSERTETQKQREHEHEHEYNVRHCIITVPAHFSRKQREKMVQTARNAGFDGYVNTLVESTAAAMAYGLFVSPTKITQEIKKAKVKKPTSETESGSDCGDGHSACGNDRDVVITKKEGRKILVCDVGGGTTDITIADMSPNHTPDDDDTATKTATATTTNNNNNHIEPSFQVLATAGERKLGGDQMDEALARYIVEEKMKTTVDLKGKDYLYFNKLRMACRNAKENLCGNGNDIPPKDRSVIEYSNDEISNNDRRQNQIEITITQDEFNDAIRFLIDRVNHLIDKTLTSCGLTCESIDEVILVGGATRTPSIRRMLQQKFQKNELCYSINADAAVAQGAAIQCAIVSGLVPKHELRNAMMLDALPHTIGVLVSSSTSPPTCGDGDGGGDGDEVYVPILERGMALPAMSYASFHLADVRQKGVTIIAVEDVGEDLPLQRIGEFNFLLHRLQEDKLQLLGKNGRTIDVGMTVDSDAKFIVSIFDSNDPDDLKKKERYQEWKRRQSEDNESNNHHLYQLGKKEPSSKNSNKLAIEEVILLISCVMLFCLYVLMRLLFHEAGKEGSKII